MDKIEFGNRKSALRKSERTKLPKENPKETNSQFLD